VRDICVLQMGRPRYVTTYRAVSPARRELAAVRESRTRRVWQTEHTAGEIQEAGSRDGNYLKGWMLAVPNVRGALVSNISGSMGTDCGPLRRRHSGKGRAVPGCCSSVLVPSLRCA
jgi:hypothetical protein